MATKRPQEQDTSTKKRQRGLSTLLEEQSFTDVVLVVEERQILAHRCVLRVVPFFEAAFRTAPAMAEGRSPTPEASTLTIRLAITYAHALALVRHAYDFPVAECLPPKLEELLTLYEALEMFEHAPLLSAIWSAVSMLRLASKSSVYGELTTEERVRSLSFARRHSLDLCVGDEDVIEEVALRLSYEDVHYACKESGGLFRSDLERRKVLLVVTWLLHGEVEQDRAQALLELCELRKVRASTACCSSSG
jgi:hypothetical protein